MANPRVLTQRTWHLTVVLLVVFLSAPALGGYAQTEHEAAVEVECVALFKNGLGYFTSLATLPEGTTTVRLRQLPVPSHGTFWVSYPKSLELRSLITRMETIAENRPARSLGELVLANPGREVVVSVGPENKAAQGIVVEMDDASFLSEPPSPYFMGVRREPNTNWHGSAWTQPPVVMLQSEQGMLALNGSSITGVRFVDKDVSNTVTQTSKQPCVDLMLAKEAHGEEVAVSCLARGITWSPSYLIDISDPATAKLSAKAVVVNEVADMEDVRLELVTGFPNIQFAEVNSPISMSQTLEAFLKALTERRSEPSGRQGMMMQQAMISNNAAFYAPSDTSPVPGYSTAQEGTVAEDLFLYPVDGFTLARGETACIPLFTAEVPYEHIYTWAIPDKLDENEQRGSGFGPNGPGEAEEVWHSCRLTNNMDMPWTTAAAEFIAGGRFTGQDVCYYTGPGAETTIRINRAMNVVAEEVEVEVDRTRNATQVYGYHYDLVQVKGRLRLRNGLDKPASVEVTKNLSGEVVETVPEARDTATAKGLKRVNTRHVLVWELDLEAGQNETLTYVYQVYVRS